MLSNNKPRSKSVPSIKQLTKYIRYRRDAEKNIGDGINLWRPNPTDPYIYISFSTKQLLATYGKDEFVAMSKESKKIEDLEEKLISKFTEIILDQWVDRANLSVKFLPADATKGSIKKKNVCFLINSKQPVLSMIPNVDAITMHLRSQSLREQMADLDSPSEYKIIMFSELTFSNFNNQVIYTLLHELGHALAEFKHYFQYIPADVEPFAALDCSMSVMGYYTHCKQILNKEAKVYGEQIVSVKDPNNPVIQKKIQQVYSAYPTQLGPLDIEAAREFNESWKKRNEKALVSTQATNKKNNRNRQRSSQHLHADLFISPAYMGGSISLFDYYVNQFCEMLRSCTSYFPPDNPTYWKCQNQALFFNQTNADSFLITNCIAQNPSLLLKTFI